MALLVVFNWEVMVVLNFAQGKLVQFTGVFDYLEVRNDLLPGLPDFSCKGAHLVECESCSQSLTSISTASN